MRAWGVPQDGVRAVEIVGMEYYQDEVEEAFRKTRGSPTGAYVIHERDNHYDEWACAVLVEGLRVGYLPSYEAKRYGPIFAALEQSRLAAWTGCQLRNEYDGFVGLPRADALARIVASVLPQPPPVAIPGPRFVLWGSSTKGVDIDGEAEHMLHLYRLIENRQPGFEIPAALASRAGRWRVIIAGSEVGYLSPSTEKSHGEVLGRVAARGALPIVTAEVDWDEDHESGPWPWVKLQLADPDELVPMDAPPRVPHELLPQGGQLKMANADAESAAEVVAALTGSPIGRALVHGVLSEDGASKPRVSVEVGGVHLGDFTPAMSKHLVPLVRTVEATGRRAVVGVAITAMPGTADVKVLARRASDTPLEWFQQRAARQP